MYTNIIFNPAAFKHGISEDDVKWAEVPHFENVTETMPALR
jgi:hypothetical protein